MDVTIKNLIDSAKKDAYSNKELDKNTLIQLLSIESGSEESEYLKQASREVTDFFFGKSVRIGSSIGVDLRPCPMNCKFCSLGEEWGLVTCDKELTDSQILELAKDVISKGFIRITLRTTEFFPINRLIELAKMLRENILEDFFITANTGEFTTEQAIEMHNAGFTGVYHTLRLREGVDTPFNPQDRIDTINSVIESPLKITVGIEPIGSEHTAEEIADKLIYFRSLDIMSVCIMKRVNVDGIPLNIYPEISEDRLGEIVAVTRLALGGKIGIATHPPTIDALSAGANHMTIEIGANPRDDNSELDCWRPFDHKSAVEMIKKSGLIPEVDYTGA